MNTEAVDWIRVARERERAAAEGRDAFHIGQPVRVGQMRGDVVGFQANGDIVILPYDSPHHRIYPPNEVQPTSIKKSHGVEGHNFVD